MSCLSEAVARSAPPSLSISANHRVLGNTTLAAGRIYLCQMAAVCCLLVGNAAAGAQPLYATAGPELPDAPVAHLGWQSGGNGTASQQNPVAGTAAIPQHAAHETADPSAQQSATATSAITGTVEDSNGDVIQGAKLVLTAFDGTTILQTSGSDGQFSFTGLAAGTYSIAVTGKGWGRFSLPKISLAAGESRILEHVILPASSGVTEVRVDGSATALSLQQVQIAVQQRVMGVFPNFYSSFDWNAPPMLPRQKYALAFRSMIDPMTFVGAGVIAGVEQARDTFPGYGQGVAGYGRRYGAAYANSFTGRMLGGAVFPSLFHQDPRYFYMGSGSIFKRALYAISTALITRGDNGRWQPNYSHVLGNFTAGAISNLYYPSSSRGLSLTLLNGALETAGDAGTDFAREFFLRGMTSHVPASSNGKP